MNELGMSQYSKLSMASKLHIERHEFVILLKLINAKFLDEEASQFFDYLLSQKVRLYQKLYPHLNVNLGQI